ncbi:putative bifunctional diguanylate cyclase/phosphodiesterase [Thaumasiovibrio subtropicus]|uniref:putative bifunctional diguanylate cyclase/phosphodiesterase n=1 Tax=Thaumasiovibrio subtropicus TaxID=1891207 RepID=UPI000B35A6C1|nr:bifunctional diguanylate cyclase/phosphodiesterase [Thaumasiovibrio subtropicus]
MTYAVLGEMAQNDDYSIEALNTRSQERMIELFSASNEGLWEMSPEGLCTYYTPSFYRIFNLPMPQSTLEEWQALIHPEDRNYFSNNVNHQIGDHVERFKSQYRVRNRHGEYVWIESTGIIKQDDDGNVLYMIGAHSDITREKTQRDHIYTLAYRDPLTKTYNRRKLLESLNNVDLAVTAGAVIYTNINFLKIYTDTFGYDSGNDVIRAAAEALIKVFSDVGDVFRIDNGEFAVLLDTLLPKQAISDRLEVLKRQFNLTLKQYNHSYAHNLISGVCMLPNPEASAENVVFQAKFAMLYAIKTDMSYCFSDFENYRDVQRRLFIETGIKSALDRREFYILFQPIVSSANHKVESFEALVRWRSENYGEIYPDEFISVAESNKTIVELGYFVIAKACEFIRLCKDHHDLDIKVSVNVSVLQLLQAKFVKRVQQTLAHFNLPASCLIIEITESLILESETFAIEQIHALRHNGFSVSLDDFGTGYSSLESFFSIPFNQLKIDRKIIAKAMTEWEVAAYLSSLVDLCKRRKIAVVGEGIETEEMLKQAKEIGINYLQGYYFAKPTNRSNAIEFANLHGVE